MLMFKDIIEKHGNAFTVKRNPLLKKIKTVLIIPLILLCAVLSIALIRSMQTPLRFLCIPAFLAFILFYAFVYAKIGSKESDIILTADENSITYVDLFHNTITIPVSSLTGIEDKSFYYDFNGNGPSNKGWNHKIILTYNIDGMFKKTDIDSVNLTHEDFCALLDHLNMLHRFIV